MARPRSWVLNFDADDELAAGPGYTPSPAVLARFPALTDHARGLLAEGDRLVEAGAPPRPAGVYEGRAWSPTPRALRLLERAGAIVPDAPPLGVLRRVTHRAFAASLGQTLPGACFVTALDEAERALALPSPTGTWLCKRAFGFAGRGKRRIGSGPLAAPDRAWVKASLGEGMGLQIEPLVQRALDMGLHGFVDRGGALTLGAPTVQQIDASGQWRGSERAAAGLLAREEEDALVRAAEQGAAALREAGYFGPFGVDAFRWIDEHGRARFQPRSEINARYSMGWAVGMGELRPDLVIRAG
ncbi:MAG: hypothetical protein U0359_34615 [Byssovorax sp.]